MAHRDFQASDLIVIGGGAAGMAAAATGASFGLKVMLFEISPYLGGTSALSAGSLWVPSSSLVPDSGDGFDTAMTYLDTAVGNRSSRAMREAFLRFGPVMVDALTAIGAIDLAPYPHHPDYLADTEGATTSGRALGARAFDGRLLGSDLTLLRPPLPEFTIFGGMMVDRKDIGHLLTAHKRAVSFYHATHLLLRHARDRLSGPRGTRLVMGNALAGRLLWTLLRQSVDIRTNTKIDRILVEGGKAVGVVVEGVNFAAHRGVVVATGGFSHHARLRAELLPEPVAAYSAVPESNRGGGIDLLIDAGGHLSHGHANAAFWAPSSVRRREDGSLAVFPHFVLDRAKPGIIAVDGAGRRFVNESTSYQLFVEGMYKAGAIPCHLVCNGNFIRRYGLGMIRPRTRDLRPYLDDGYIVAGASVAELAGRIGADPEQLADSFARNDRYAIEGRDPEFGRGANAYNRNLGDPAHQPNPCLGSMGEGPYYALPIHPADIGTSVGIETDEHARVLGGDGLPVERLYTAGNDMSSVMGGIYPGPGITIGPAMTFGYIAARHAAGLLEQAG